MVIRRACLAILVFAFQSIGYSGSIATAVAADNSWTSMGLLGANIVSIATDPSNPNNVLAGTKFLCVYRSTDGGLNWLPAITLPFPAEITGWDIAFSPSDSSFVAAGTTRGLFLSHDHGQSWVKIADTEGGPLRCVYQVAISPVDQNVVFITGYESGYGPCGEWLIPNGLYRSDDGGLTFDIVYGVPFQQVSFAPCAPHIVYALSNEHAYRSEDSGLTWNVIDGNFIASPNPTALAIDPGDAQTVYMGSYASGIYKTTNGGGSWSPITGGLGSSDITNILIYSHNQQVIFATGGSLAGSGIPGVYRSNDNTGNSWSPMMTGMDSRAVTAFAIDSNDPPSLYAGTSSGIWKYTVTSGVQNYGLSINQAALFTNQTAVTLTLTAPPGTTQMEFSNDGGFGGAAWEPFAATKAWTINSAGSNILPRIVYARFLTDGQQSGQYLDDIVLDQTPPSGSITIDQLSAADMGRPQPSQVAIEAQSGLSTTVLLYLPMLGRHFIHGFVLRSIALASTDDLSGVGQMALSNDPTFAQAIWINATAATDWFIPANPGQHTVFARLKDRAGNLSGVISATTNLP